MRTFLCILLSLNPVVSFVPVATKQERQRHHPLLQASKRSNLERRHVLQSLSVLAAAAATPSRAGTVEPLIDLPMIRLRLPRGGVGRDYIAVPLKIRGQGPFDFMVDTGLTTEFITPHLQKALGIQATGETIRGLAAGGSVDSTLVELKGASLVGKDGTELPLPTLHAVTTDFPQEHIDPAHDPVEGMLG
jgi:hypothetical protein